MYEAKRLGVERLAAQKAGALCVAEAAGAGLAPGLLLRLGQ